MCEGVKIAPPRHFKIWIVEKVPIVARFRRDLCPRNVNSTSQEH